jgi:hypothetical protein
MDVLFLNTPPQECKDRIRARRNHPTLPPEKADVVVDEFMKSLHLPEKWEGPYDTVMIANNSDELKQFLKDLSQY